MCIKEEFEKKKTTVEYEGYYYKISDVIKTLILRLLSSLKTMKDIQSWAKWKRISKLVYEKFDIAKIPCYSHFTVLVGLIDSEELNKIFIEFFSKLVETVAIDGKTVGSTANMSKYNSPLHIASAFVVENGITIGQLSAERKGKEIPCVQELIGLLDITGATVVTDALHCQKKTAKEVLEAGADYVFSVKKNQRTLYDDVAEMIDFKRNDKYEQIDSPIEKVTKTEKGHGRIDKRTAFVTYEVEWLAQFGKWHGIQSLGAIVTVLKHDITYLLANYRPPNSFQSRETNGCSRVCIGN